MSSRIDTFRKLQSTRQRILKNRSDDETVETSTASSIACAEPVARYTGLDDFDNSWKHVHELAETPVTVSMEEVDGLLDQLNAKWEQQKLDQMLTMCSQKIIVNTVGPLGLGQVVAIWDKTGGNVDTLHNVSKGIYATKEEQQRYENRGEYDSYEYHSAPGYIEVNRETSEQRRASGVVDGYTGKTLKRNDPTDLDHIVSAKEIHDDPRRVLAEIDGPTLANEKTNLTPTDSSINRSKKAKSATEFLELQNEQASSRQERIRELKTAGDLTDKQRKELEKLEHLEDLDPEKMAKLDKTSRANIENKLNLAYYTSTKFASDVAITGAIEGGKMGLQQAFGLLLTDFFSAILAEAKDAFTNGFQRGVDAQGFFEALAIRCKKIGRTMIDDWKNVLTAFRDGAISGFLSNLVTTAVNTFATTLKNVVRLIREGVFSLYEAAKTLFLRPGGISFTEAADAATKIIASGLVTIGGITLTETLKVHLLPTMQGIPVLASFSNVLLTVLAGGLTGIAVALVVYALDKMDLFGAQDAKRHKYVMEQIRNGRLESEQRFLENTGATLAELGIEDFTPNSV